MMKYYCLLFSLLLSVRGMADHPVHTQVSIMYEYSPPFSYVEQGRARGIYVREMEALFKLAEVSVTHEVYPFTRALRKLQTHPDSLLFSLAQNPQRQPNFIWLGVLDSLCPALLKLEHRRDIQIQNKQDVRKYRLALVRQDYLSDRLQQQEWLDPNKVIWVADQEQAFQLFAHNKVDLMAGDPFHVQLIFNHFQQQVAFSSAYTLKEYQRQLYLAANKALAPPIQKKLHRAIAQRSQIIRQQKQPKLRLNCNS